MHGAAAGLRAGADRAATRSCSGRRRTSPRCSACGSRPGRSRTRSRKFGATSGRTGTTRRSGGSTATRPRRTCTRACSSSASSSRQRHPRLVALALAEPPQPGPEGVVARPVETLEEFATARELAVGRVRHARGAARGRAGAAGGALRLGASGRGHLPRVRRGASGGVGDRRLRAGRLPARRRRDGVLGAGPRRLPRARAGTLGRGRPARHPGSRCRRRPDLGADPAPPRLRGGDGRCAGSRTPSPEPADAGPAAGEAARPAAGRPRSDRPRAARAGRRPRQTDRLRREIGTKSARTGHTYRDSVRSGIRSPPWVGEGPPPQTRDRHAIGAAASQTSRHHSGARSPPRAGTGPRRAATGGLYGPGETSRPPSTSRMNAATTSGSNWLAADSRSRSHASCGERRPR